MRATLIRAVACSFIVVLLALGFVEGLAWVFTPQWPAYVLRPEPLPISAIRQWEAGMPDVKFAFNSWQMRDRERSVAKPKGLALRGVFIGDSLLDGSFSRASIPARIEAALHARGGDDVEAINLGVTATGPVEYYYRLQRVALYLSPDVVVMVLFAGNDFVYRSFDDESAMPRLADELPRPSILGSILPHTTWLGRRLLHLAAPVEGGALPDEQATVNAAIDLPGAERVRVLSNYMKEHYFPSLDQVQIAEILSRGSDAFWAAFGPRRSDREFLLSGFIRQMIASEAAPPAAPATADPAAVAGTLSWIAAADRLAKAHGVRFLVAIAPVPLVDPDFVAFWRPWPRYNDFSLQGDSAHRAVVAALVNTSIGVIDLRDDLEGVRGAYRKSDMHWTERGNDIVSERFARELFKLRK